MLLDINELDAKVDIEIQRFLKSMKDTLNIQYLVPLNTLQCTFFALRAGQHKQICIFTYIYRKI